MQNPSEDAQMRQAMAASMKDLPPQESGTTDGQQFGPAQRAYYPPEQWALAPVASSREIFDHPEAQKRRRVPGHPAFLRGSSETGYNAPLLTIYHSIPLARAVFLLPPLQVLEYGHNVEWWSGTTDENNKSLTTQEVSEGDEDRRRFCAEVQCLMALLDNTTRAYGSVDALCYMRYYQYFQAESLSTKLLETWGRAALDEAPNEPLTQVFTSIATRAPDIPGAQPEEKEMWQIEGALSGAQSLTEVLDKIFWPDALNNKLEDIWMERFGHIVTFRIFNDETGAPSLGISPDEELYLDRYTPELRERIAQLRKKRLVLFQDMQRLGQAQIRIMQMPGARSNQQRLNVRQALETMQKLLPVAAEDDLRNKEQLVDVPVYSPDASQVDKAIDKLLTQIDKRVKLLDQRKLDLEVQIRNLMSDIKTPSTSTVPLKHRYVLQGASTKPNITYVRRPNHDLIDMDSDDEDDEHHLWQWWRTAWGEKPDETSGSQLQETNDVPYTVRKMTSAEVLEAIKNENGRAILVYVDEIALNHQAQPLTPALRKFVEQDNAAFQEELSGRQNNTFQRPRSWSNETNSTIREDDNDPFNDQFEPIHTREATPMSTSSTIRSLSGQPSPKRPRSSDDSLENVSLLDEEPPAYEMVIDESPQEMSEKKGNKIGYFAEQMLNAAEQNERKGG